MNEAGGMRIGGEMGIDGGAYDIGGASNIAGGMEMGGASNIAGAMPKKVKTFMNELEDADHKDLYHMILGFNPAEWEAVRESAHQLMGGSASRMWGEIEGGSMDIGGGDGVTYGDLKDVVLTPSRGAAGRLLELESEANGAGFKKALKKSVKHASKLFKSGHKGLKIANALSQEIGEMGGPVGEYAQKFNAATSPALDTFDKVNAVGNVAANTDWKQTAKDALKNKENLKTGVELTNAALTGNFKEKAKEKGRAALGMGSGLEAGAIDIGGAEDIGGASNIAGAMEIGAGNLPVKKKRGGKVKHVTVNRKKPHAVPEALPLEKASASSQEAQMVDMNKGRKLHDPRKRR